MPSSMKKNTMEKVAGTDAFLRGADVTDILFPRNPAAEVGQPAAKP